MEIFAVRYAYRGWTKYGVYPLEGMKAIVNRTMYKRTKVNPLKVGELLSNIFRVISNVAELNKRLGLHLIKHDISFIYNY